MTHIRDEEMSREFGKRVAKKLATLVRSLAPTYTDDGDKAVHPDVALIGNRIVFGTDVAAYGLVLDLRPDELAKRHLKKGKNPLREVLEENPLTILVNYARLSQWLKLNEDSIRSVVWDDEGTRLRVIPGVSELRCEIRQEHRDYHERVLARLAEHTPEGSEISDELALEIPEGVEGAGVIAMLGGDILVSDSFVGDEGVAQAKVKLASLASGEAGKTQRTARAFLSPLGGHIIRVTTECPLYTARQYFRTLDITRA